MKEAVVTEIRPIDAERLSPTDVSSLLGIPYELVLKYAHELTVAGLIEAGTEVAFGDRVCLSWSIGLTQRRGGGPTDRVEEIYP